MTNTIVEQNCTFKTKLIGYLDFGDYEENRTVIDLASSMSPVPWEGKILVSIGASLLTSRKWSSDRI
jgi:hypothetical protein